MKNLRQAILEADSRLGRYDPLERILLFDDFDRGLNGWQTYFPDYDGWDDYQGRYAPVEPLNEILEKSVDRAVRVDRRLPIGPRGLPMLSSPASGGAYGTGSGIQSLKIPTLPYAGYKAFAQKRIGSPWRGKFRVECTFALEVEAAALYLTFDVMDLHRAAGPTPQRWWPALRYHQSEGGRRVQTWQYHQGAKGVKDGPWEDIPNGSQEFGGGDPPGGGRWHMLRYTFDLGRHELTDLACDGREFPVAGLPPGPRPPLEGWRASTDKCSGLIGTAFGVEASVDQRCSLYLESILVSGTIG